MATKLYLYTECKITRDRNARVDDIEDYLATCVATGWEDGKDIQYQQIALNKKLKLDLDQLNVGKQNYNYLKVYQDEKAFYFFIDKANWKSTSTVEFDLTLDTVNTFANDFTFNKKTRITRQHKDRLAVDYGAVKEPVNYDDPLEKNQLYVFNITKPSQNSAAISDMAGYIDGKFQIYDHGNKIFEQTGLTGIAFTGNNLRIYFQSGGVEYHNDYSYDTISSDFVNRKYYVLYLGDNTNPDSYNYGTGWEEFFYGKLIKRFRRLIDQEPEGINPPLFKVNEEKINDSNSNVNWYLLFRSQSEDVNSAIDTFLIPDVSQSIYISGNTTIDLNNLQTNAYYYFVCKYQWGVANYMHGRRIFEDGNEGSALFVLTYDSGNSTDSQFINGHSKDYGRNDDLDYQIMNTYYMKLYKTATGIEAWYCMIYQNDFTNNLETTVLKHYENITAVKWVSNSTVLSAYRSTINYNNITGIYNNRNNMTVDKWYSFPVQVSIDSLNTLQRTDPQLIKLIALPYSVIPTNQSGMIVSDWVQDTTTLKPTGFSALKLQTTNIPDFSQKIEYTDAPYKNLFTTYSDPTANDSRVLANESKLYNSEFYTPKFVYDSFNYQYLLENIDNNENLDTKIDYKFTNTMNSRCLFTFNVPLKRSTSDYDNICVVDRNNELPLYNSSYLNYVRTGYNYDVKNKNAQLSNDIALAAVKSVGAAVATGLAGAKVGAAVGAGAGSAAGPVGALIGAAVGLAGGIATSIIGIANSQSKADRNIQQKLDESRQQSTSVSGGDDVDLLTTYTAGNKAKFVEYKCSDRVEATINDLFYYCGYADDRFAIPELDTRLWFNFVQCEPVFDEEDCTVYKDYLDDIKVRYQLGITDYHKINDSYDWDQTKENWETNLL